MAKEDAALQFPAFPFKPYSIQLEFMAAVYRAIDEGGVGIVESPTGTGKTLSLICSALQWLQDRHSQTTLVKDGGVKKPTGNEDGSVQPDWMRNFNLDTGEQKQTEFFKKQRVRKLRKGEHDGRSRSMQSFLGEADACNLQKHEAVMLAANSSDMAEDASFLLDEYESEDEKSRGGVKRTACSSSEEDEEGREDKEEEKAIKVYFCSRTHSQLSQFIGELHRTEFDSSVQVVSLGSRKTLCINPDVKKLSSSSRINERCLELQKSKTSGKVVKNSQKDEREKKSGGCVFLKKTKLQRKFREEILDSPALDIEDLVQLGTNLGTCPYYGSRRALPSAELVVLPYQALLHSDTRESLGLKLSNSVVIIDEAHNLVDTISNIHSCQLSFQQLRKVHAQLSEYLKKFHKRLAAGNRRYIEIILVLLKAFLQRISLKEPGPSSLETADDAKPKPVPLGRAWGQSSGGETEIMTINDFLFSLSIDNINMFKLRRYIKESNIVHKVSSYGEKLLLERLSPGTGSKSTASEHAVSAPSAFHTFAEFILALTNNDSDGRILVKPSNGSRDSAPENNGFLKFIMLNTAKQFAEIVKQARAIILAGGTLQPVVELRARLFPYLSESKEHIFSCGHIVPPESILPIAIAQGTSGRTFDFTYKSRGCQATIEELGRLICNICSVVPDGIVVFFPSYDYESQVFAVWKNSGLLASIDQKKTVFREPRNTTDVEVTLEKYKATITSRSPRGLSSCAKSNKGGAVLLCVVGGKMSEGINFSDGMGRCVVMVGLPYPSPGDPELVERMKYIDQMNVEGQNISGQSSREYYENLCMKAVNQSIGRAIRHIGDYAAILLVDVRYTRAGTGREHSAPVSKLAGWIKQRLVCVNGGYGEVHMRLHQFFKFNSEKQSGMLPQHPGHEDLECRAEHDTLHFGHLESG